ncbi:unnamed protein product, partial [Meganyctiphanes norvegica]
SIRAICSDEGKTTALIKTLEERDDLFDTLKDISFHAAGMWMDMVYKDSQLWWRQDNSLVDETLFTIKSEGSDFTKTCVRILNSPFELKIASCQMSSARSVLCMT